MNKTISIILLSTLFLCGCISWKAITVPIDSTPLSEDKATLIIYTEETMVLDGYNIFIDRQLVGKIYPEKPLKFEIEPGYHELNSSEAMAIDRITTQEFDKGKTYFMKVWRDYGLWVGSIRIDPTYKIDSYDTKVPEKLLNKHAR